jgi:cytochrome c biogenesis protein ResB
MTEDREKNQTVEDSQTDAGPTSHIDAQREEAQNPSDQNPAQQDPPTDTGLQTPQPDQRMPTEEERAEDPDVPQDAPEGYEPQVDLQPGQTPGIEERPGEQVTDVEEDVDDKDETNADANDDESVDHPESE